MKNRVAEELKEYSRHSTHYEGCEKNHPMCKAVKEIERLQAEVDWLREELKTKK